jgi:putative ABC transport system permease protein
MVIDTAFEISSKEREKQFGILQSIGASKKQIVRILLSESLYLSIFGIPFGIAVGIAVAYGIYRAMLTSGIALSVSDENAVISQIFQFSVSPLFLVLTAVTGLVWVLLSAYGTGMRITKMSPIEAINSRTGGVKKVAQHSVEGALFGWAGKLAARNTRRNKKRFVITVLSVTLSITLFVAMSYAIDTAQAILQADVYYPGYDFYIEPEDGSTDMSGENNLVSSDPTAYKKYEKALLESGYFSNVHSNACLIGRGVNAPMTDEFKEMMTRLSDLEEEPPIYVDFLNEQTFNELVGDESPVSYSELAEQNGFLLFNKYYDSQTDTYGKSLDINVGDTLTNNAHYIVYYDEPIEVEDDYGNLESVSSEYVEKELDLNILGILDRTASDDNDYLLPYYITLYATEEQYDEFYCSYSTSRTYISFSADLADGASYEEASRFVSSCGMCFTDDYYGTNLKTARMMAAIKIFAHAVTALIAVIAIINMVNVISTGIVNRRTEIASLKSLVMSKMQLRKTTAIECFEFAMTSGVLSAFLSYILLAGTNFFIVNMGFFDEVDTPTFISYAKPIPYLIIAAAAAFIVCLTASILPIRSIEKKSITDTMRSID